MADGNGQVCLVGELLQFDFGSSLFGVGSRR